MRGLNASWALTLGLLCVVVGPGCEEKSDAPKFVPDSVPPEKPIEELDPEEQEAFCEEAVEWAGDLIEEGIPRLLCRTEGLQAGAAQSGFDVAACLSAEKACLAAPPEDDDLDGDNLSCNFEGLDASCDVTVADFAGCFEEATTLLDRAIAATTCERIGAGNVPNEADFQVSASCQAVLDNCNGDGQDDNVDSAGGKGDDDEVEETDTETEGGMETMGDTDAPPPE